MELNDVTPEFEPLINPQEFIGFIERQWFMILSLTLVCALVAGLISLILPKSYTANALVVSTRVTYTVSLGSVIDTQTEEEFYSVLDRQSRLESFALMVKNPAVAQLVLDDLADQLNGEIDSEGELLELVKGEIIRGSDTIQISVTHSDPEMAAAIANSWVVAYVSYVNDVFAETESRQTYDMIKRQTADAQIAFDQAQSTLESHIRQDRGVAITRQIDETQRLIDNLVAARDQALVSAMNNQTHIPLLIFDTQAQAPMFIIEQQVEDLQGRINQAYSDKRRVDKLMRDAEGMLLQVQLGGDGAAVTNALALEMLKAQVFAANGGLGELMIQTIPISITSEAMLVDLDGLVSSLEDQRGRLENDIVTLTLNLDNILVELEAESASLDEQAAVSVQSVLDLKGLDEVFSLSIESSSLEQKILELEQIVRDLQGDSFHELSVQDQLTRERDLAKSTYISLATKEAEISITTQTKSSQVAIGSTASVPLDDNVSGMVIVVVSGVSGFVLVTLWALAFEFWWNYKDVEPRPMISYKSNRKRS